MANREELQEAAEQDVVKGIKVLLKSMSETEVRRFVEHVLNEARRG